MQESALSAVLPCGVAEPSADAAAAGRKSVSPFPAPKHMRPCAERHAWPSMRKRGTSLFLFLFSAGTCPPSSLRVEDALAACRPVPSLAKARPAPAATERRPFSPNVSPFPCDLPEVFVFFRALFCSLCSLMRRKERASFVKKYITLCFLFYFLCSVYVRKGMFSFVTFGEKGMSSLMKRDLSIWIFIFF